MNNNASIKSDMFFANSEICLATMKGYINNLHVHGCTLNACVFELRARYGGKTLCVCAYALDANLSADVT